MEKIIVARTLPESVELPSHIHPLLRRILLAREVRSAQEIQYDLMQLTPYHQLLNSEKAAELLVKMIMAQKKIIIIGDYDADGATSSALALRALKAMGALAVEFLVPNRFTYGYGLTPAIVDMAAAQHPDLIVTVDNGIASHAGVAHARALGIQVLVTDHHLAPLELPAADVIVNPNQPGDHFPSKCLAGVGVIFYVMCALRAALQAQGWFAEQALPIPNMAQFLDLVALGTVADVVPLDFTNRLLVHQGLKRIRAGQCCPGITALLRIAGRNPSALVAADLGFAVGPRLNAAGRLDDMSLGIHCLLSDNEATALGMAAELNQLNIERRAIENGMQLEAMGKVDQWLARGGELPLGICLYEPDWHQGVIGLVASRVKEKVHRPVIAFADDKEGWIKGSARSIPGLHIRDILEKIALNHPSLIDKFGGHAMAAGLSLLKLKFQDFQRAFNEAVRSELGSDYLQGKLETDGELQESEFSLEIANLLREAGPWGQNFPEPLFEGIFELVDQRLLAEKHLKLTLRLLQSKKIIDGIAFNVDNKMWPNYRIDAVRLVFRLDINSYQGVSRLQLMIENLMPSQINEIRV